MSDKQILFTNAEHEGISYFEEEKECVEDNKNDILFLAQENNEDKIEQEGGIVDLEVEMAAALEKIENLKLLNEKQEQHYQVSKNLFVTRLT